MRTNNSLWSFIDKVSQTKGITEIIINSADNIYIEKEGELIRLNVKLNESDIGPFCQEVATLNNTLFDQSSPIVDGVLPDGSRINIINEVYTQSTPAITIRRYLKKTSTIKNLLPLLNLDSKWEEFLSSLVHSRQNIIICGGTGCGKTTLLNSLMQEVSPTQRVVTLEDTRELNFNLPNVVHLVSKTSNLNTKGLSIQDLLKNVLRMRPDRIILGEVRGGEVYDLLQMMNTGHKGSMSTLHANSTTHCLSRLENLFMLSGLEVPVSAIRRQIVDAVDFIIHMERLKSGKRVIKGVSELAGMEGDKILLHDIVALEKGKTYFTGLVPIRVKSLMNYGIDASFF